MFENEQSVVLSTSSSGSSQSTETPRNPVADKFEEEIRRVHLLATPDDHRRAGALTIAFGVQEVTPTVAAVLFIDFNKVNRKLTYSKAYGYATDMQRGEWALHHQGVAFYASDHTLADGQHRLAAVVLSGVTVKFMFYPDIEKSVIDKIDRSTRRTAGEALEMMGVRDGKIKASMAKLCLEYEHVLKAGDKKARLTDPQIEAFVNENDHLVSDAHLIGHNSTFNVSNPCLSEAEASTIGLLMLRGGYSPHHTVAFIAALQTGVSTYSDSPTLVLSQQFANARENRYKTKRLTKWQKLALAMKAAGLWLENRSTGKLKWDPAKEKLPSNRPPVAQQSPEG